METETFIADETDNKELENLKNEWENLRIEVDKLKRKIWIDTLLGIIALCLMLYVTLQPMTLESMKMYQDNIAIYAMFFFISIIMAVISAFRGDYYFEIRTVLDRYQSLHQIIHKRYAKKQEVIIDDDTAIEVGRMLSNMKSNSYPFPKFIYNIFLAIYVICFLITGLLMFGTVNKAEKDKEQTQFSTLENKMIILDNKLTKLQVQNDSLKIEIELLKKQVKK